MDPRILALVNIIVQIVLIVLVAYAAYSSKVTKDLKRHCLVMRIAVPVLIVTIALVMGPSLLGYTRLEAPISPFRYEMWVHASLGLAVVVLWVFVNLALTGVIKVKHRLLPYMRTAAVFWVVVFVLGIHMYVQVWL